MRFISSRKISDKAFLPHQMLFLDCWHGLTHHYSLDSFRVKCLNSRTIVKELSDELEIGRIEKEELEGLCRETLTVLQNDHVVSSFFGKGFALLKPLLERPPLLKDASDSGKDKEKEKEENRARRREMKFATTDILSSLQRGYFEALCSTLIKALSNAESGNVESLTNSIVSDLVAQGWELSELYGWHYKFLANDGRSFDQNLSFMLKQLGRTQEGFEVKLRISGGRNIRQISHLGSFSLSRESGIALPEGDKQLERFATDDVYSTFAEVTLQSVDFLSAAIFARDKIEPLLDALRFEFEPSLLKIERHAFVRRTGDGREMLVEVANPVPNPADRLDQEDFKSFAERLSSLLGCSHLDTQSKNRIETAFRRYRFGRDSENYTDKFLHWWMGLEVLTGVGGMHIGPTVTDNVSYIMLCGYMQRILQDLVLTIRTLRIEWTEQFVTCSGSPSLNSLTVKGLIHLLRDQTARDSLWSAVNDRPHVLFHAKQVSEWVQKPNEMAKQIESHHQRLRWHVQRLYRIRCCIVHGAPVRFRLALFSANLEYYLKQSLSLTLDVLFENPHVPDTVSLYQRAGAFWKRQIELLKKADAPTETVDDAIFAEIVPKN